MEEDIKILETVVNYRKFDGIYSTNEVIFKALENILNELDRLQKENELAKETIKKHCSDMDNINNILAKLQKENEVLKENLMLANFDKQVFYTKALELKEDSIPKQVIKDKLEERKQRLINGKISYTNRIRLNELNYISKELLKRG